VSRATSERIVSPAAIFLRHHGPMLIGALVLGTIIALAIASPWLGTIDPQRLSPIARLRPPSDRFWFGTDAIGRDLYSRVLYGGRVSILVGVSVAVLSAIAGTALGLATGFFRSFDAVAMRVLEAFMAIPAILLAIALIALTRASVENVIIALAIAETPRVTRLVRSVVLTLREQPFVEAAVAIGAPVPVILVRHILPNALAPLIVQSTFICGSAIIAESVLSFIGAGTPNALPTWGNIIADGRNYFQIHPNIIFFPAVFLSLTVLSINLLGDGLRDLLDPRLSKQI
jgi:peptide/nickel transport system permease protein